MTRAVLRSSFLACSLALAALPGLAGTALAGDPVMPLGQVAQGMRCTAYSVIQGTTISSFDAQVVDVVSGDPSADAPRILVRFSGPAIERTGVGPGFSGSPIYCDGGDGVQRVAGAISESVGEYGGMLALVTPIEQILAQPVDPPTAAGSSAAARAAGGLATPISVSGLTGRAATAFQRAAARAGRVLSVAPFRPRAAAFPVQELKPGASMAVGLSSGDLTAGAVGTVSYVDGDRVWAFGHPLDAAGRRSLFLQDAYVYAVVNNPVQSQDVATYKLAAPGHDVGILSGDGLNAVAGRLGALPARFPMKVIARDQDTGRQRVVNVQVADEGDLGLPAGTSPLALVGSGAVAQAASTILGAAPARQTGELCARIGVRERRKPLRFCNRYLTRGAAGDSGTDLGVGTPMVTDFAEAVTDVDEYNFGALHVTGVEVNLKVRRGLRQAYLVKGSAPAVVRRGHDVRVRVKVREVRGAETTRTITVHVPRGMPTGPRKLTLEGTGADAGAALEIDLSTLLFGGTGDGSSTDGSDEAGPRTLDALAKRVAGIGRYDGVRASFQPEHADPLDDTPTGPEAVAQKKRRVLRDPEVRLSGTVRIPVDVE